MDDIFYDEMRKSIECLEKIEKQLTLLEQNPNDPDIVNSLHNHMKNIANTSSFWGLSRLTDITQSIKNILHGFCDNRLEIKAEYISTIIESIRQVRFLFETAHETGDEPEGNENALLAQLETVLTNQMQGATTKKQTPAFRTPSLTIK